MWAGVAFRAPASTVVAAALRIGQHHAVAGLAADQTFVDVPETNVLVGGGAIWGPQRLWINADQSSETLFKVLRAQCLPSVLTAKIRWVAVLIIDKLHKLTYKSGQI